MEIYSQVNFTNVDKSTIYTQTSQKLKGSQPQTLL